MTEPGIPPVPPSPGGAVSQNRGIMIVLSYLWLLALIPLLVEKEDREVQWHAKHGIVLMVAEFILWIAVMVVTWVLAVLTQGASGCVTVPLLMLMWVAVVVLHIVCMVKGNNGERFLVPGVSQYADRF